MMFNSADIESLVSRALVIECFEITLTQNVDESPFTFCGPGSIKTQSDGQLSLKMYDAAKKSSISQMMRYGLYNQTGIVPESDYFSLRAIDSSGNVWVAPRLYIYDGLRMTPHGTIVEFQIPDIRTERIHPRSDLNGVSIANAVIAGKFRLPFNKWQDQPDGSSSVSALDFEIDGARLKLSQKVQHLELDVESDVREIDHELLMTISESISIAIGRDAWPTYYRLYNDGVTRSFINGRPDVKGLGMIKPLVDVFPYKTASLISFVNHYVNNRDEEHRYLVYYWRRLYHVSSRIGDVAALVLTVNIEGLVNNYFSAGRAPSERVLGEVNYSKKLIRSLRLPSSTNSRIKNVLGAMKKLSAPNILRVLEAEGVIESVHVKSWNDLRHSLAHAGNSESDPVTTSKFFLDIENCLDLFYRLIGLSVGYDASLVEGVESLKPAEIVVEEEGGGSGR
ncbi:hypothetical protein [Pseudomonas sp. NFPP24]|uniref:hypothetical protein n=1 Tax=Pseudomonas sp. NFPP24 TaxID=1566228 RepID=UPI0008E6CFD8|nr:hypothetical protein [Pseudomonas sp. NFPP24]SFA81789.1 hypothetical protein SAMN03159485_00792 [Pseudomonas sp. NFPP24]